MTWTSTTALMAHQIDAVAKLIPTRIGALFADLGTGKSRILLELARLRQLKFNYLVWFCPVSAMENTRREILKHTDIPADMIYVFGPKTNVETIPLDRCVYIVGIESMQSSNRIFRAVDKLITEQSYVAVDESTYIKGAFSRRTKRITGLSERARYRCVMTGTPLTQGAVDLYAQMRFLSPKILGYQSFGAFGANHLEYRMVRMPGRRNLVRTDHVVRAHNVEYLAARIAPYTYQIRAEECLDLPGAIHETRWFAMTKAQRRLYEQVKEQILREEEENMMNPMNSIWIFRLFSALQAVICGYHGISKQEMVRVEHDRVENMLAVISEIPEDERIVVWSKYLPAAADIKAALENRYGAGCVATFTGPTANTRESELAEWKDGKRRFLVATQQSGSHAQTWIEAAFVIFYADGFKFSEREQAEKRTMRFGQTRKVRYVTLRCSDSIDEKIGSAIGGKRDTLREFKRQVDVYRAQGLKAKIVEAIKSL